MSWKTLEQTQEKVVKMLTNSIHRDRLAHAYIFEGARGTGKKEVAFQLAKSYFCKERTSVEPCQHCSDCKRITSKNHPDVHLISPDGQSIKKQQVEHLQKEFSYRGVESKQKIYIVEHADKMTASAANSLLKFLEEPNSPTIAILLTENIHQILRTVLSRSQVLTFAPLKRDQYVEQLVESGMTRAMAVCLGTITTNISEAEKLSQDDWIVQARNVVLQLTEEVHSRPHHVLFTLQEKWLPLFQGKEQGDLGIELLLLWYRDLLYMQMDNKAECVFVDQVERLEQQALYTSQDKLQRQMTAIFEAKRHLHANVNPQLLMEKLLFKLQEG
ncbi:DNA polymerase III subunit delta' [Alkalihalobacillus sp. LMS39]|uniref:DNA polymerase III subunit delta' n=1 Tax=Alkalihalobacillus sp. LMS39 TaxID=2924032 RepID=UPI001FB3D383|nr:DNA polymerase III subunit delta' [Alkalihalobacillus sp. LMS39]UOE94172.1 DNA polymerase III subunit delta' [Alkalihalobacillus sp. LMS39]